VNLSKAGGQLNRWKTAGDIERINFTTRKYFQPPMNEALLIDEGGRGAVYFGRIKFKGVAPKRVALKVFHTPLSDKLVARYQQVIEDLRAAGLQLPKIGLVKIPVEKLKAAAITTGYSSQQKDVWIQVTPLFGSVRNPKKMYDKVMDSSVAPEHRADALKQLLKVVDAGYIPDAGLFAMVPGKSGRRVMPFDIDIMAERGKRPLKERVKELVDCISMLSGPRDAEKEALTRLALSEAQPLIKRRLIQELKRTRS
jgi:hypothetical protein